jgi:hypothetical protein
MEIARGWGRAVYQRLRAIDTPPGWKSPIRFFDTVAVPPNRFQGAAGVTNRTCPGLASYDVRKLRPV